MMQSVMVSGQVVRSILFVAILGLVATASSVAQSSGDGGGDEGTHDISWDVKDPPEGFAGGIGSRYFYVKNTPTTPPSKEVKDWWGKSKSLTVKGTGTQK
jgi:hypothetical protein